MSLKIINRNIEEFGEIQRSAEKHSVYSFISGSGSEIKFEYKGSMQTLVQLIGHKDPSETLKNKVHFHIIEGKESDEETDEFSFAKDLMEADDKIIQLFAATKDFLDLIINGHSNACVVSGMSQIGKSTFVMNYLEEAKKKAVRAVPEITLLKGASSPMALYDFIYAHRNKIIVIDDCDSVFDNERGLNVLKAVLDPSEIRRVCWISGEAAVPEFDFEGRIIFISNYSFFKMRKNKNFRHVIAVINRTNYIEIDGNSKQVFEYIKNIEHFLYPNKDIRKQILQFLEDTVGRYNLRITPQLFKDLCAIREFKAQKFEQLAKVKLMSLMLN